MAKESSKPWENYTPPGGQTRIEGTDEVPLVTDQPVEFIPRIKKAQPQAESLFPPEPASPSAEPETKPKTSRPYRARYSDTTNESVRALRAGIDAEPPVESNPDADIDEVFGAEHARRIL
jgi:hypothetical protein